jgi:hypothetical protein
VEEGWTVVEAARKVGMGERTARAYLAGMKRGDGDEYRAIREEKTLEGPIALDKVKPDVQAALDDIAIFAERYFGAIVMPWQAEATRLIVDLQATPAEEYVVINCPPGSGKSTFFTKILPAWITCRQRHIRGMIGSASMTMAKQYVGELRDVLSQPLPLHQPPEAIRAGIAVTPKASLLADFGRFKAEDRKWASDAFFVLQHGGVSFSAKEPTWQAFGRGSTFLGARVDFCIWDDVYDPEQVRTEDARQGLRDWWKTYAETRLEPGGLMVLQGQRMDPEDIYRFALDQKAVTFDAAGEAIDSKPKYHHIKFKAHYDDRCKGAEGHSRSSAPYPEGCLLFPRRLPFAKLASERENNPEGFEMVYQQEDAVPGMVLVDKVWVTGGRDRDGEDRPGCWDEFRGACELPEGLTRPILSVVTADPSPTRYWSVQWWAYHPETEQRFLLDLVRQAMAAPDFLDWRIAERRFDGLMEEWQRRSEDLGLPITHWIVEQNAAQRFMLQYDHTKTWLRVNKVSLIPHETQRNKSDPKLGVSSLGPLWKHGQVRLPGRQNDPGRFAAAKLVSEATRFRLDGKPSGTNDCVMAQWFLEWNLPGLKTSLMAPAGRLARPSWMRRVG